ncbi:MAG: transcriptional regulator [Burkholderiales bacterium]|jgi:predicted transcriptional regulator|nr:transcriptional regulator [Burkholderiales bacterium]
MDNEAKILNLMKKAGTPVSAGDIEKASGLDRKEVDKAFKALKTKGLITSPVRCKWEPAKK